MEKTITIVDVEDKDYEGKSYKRILDTEGHYYNVKQGMDGVLEAKWGILQEGNKITLTMGEFKGKSFVRDIELLERVEDTPEPKRPRENSIETQVAAKIVSELWLADKLDITSCEVKGLRVWICEHLPIKENPLVEEAKRLGAVVLKEPVETGALSEPPEFKNVGEFLTKAIKTFPELKTKGDIEKILGSNIEKVTDFQGAWVFLTESLKNA